MQLIALVQSTDHVCCRYRLAAMRPHLDRAGHRLELRPLPRQWWSQLRLWHDLRKADAVILQRKLLQPWQLRFLRRAARALIYDFDDAVFVRDSYAPKGIHSGRRLRRFAATVRAADWIVAGNPYLAQQARAHAGSDCVQIVPTCIEPGRYSLAEHRAHGNRIQLVWIGSSSTLQGLEKVVPILEDIGRHRPGIRLKLICDRFLALDYVPVIECRWSEEREARDLATADIGISWLPDDPWSRGKCGLKVLQYMAAGLPVVANPVGVQSDLVRHGESGFLVDTPAQWLEAVGRLADDASLRRRMGLAGRRRVEAEFRVGAGAARWIDLLRHLPRRQVA